MIKHNVYKLPKSIDSKEKELIVSFLYKHLEEYGDAKVDIQRAVEYAFKEITSFGGFVVTAVEDDKIVGAVVVNQTGMNGYIPENILVYIATHNAYRGKGVGKALMMKSIEVADGDIALHVEPENPARFLYEKIGFKSKYIEMRYKKQ